MKTNTPQERNYLETFYGSKVKYIEQENKEFSSSYKAIEASHIVIGAISSILREAVALKKKVLFCDFTKDSRYSPYKKEYILSKFSYLEFEKRVNYLLKKETPLSEEDIKYSHYLNNYNQLQPTHKIISETIKSYLS